MPKPGSGSTLRIYLLLMALGAIGGALASIPLTWLGKVITEAPDPATLANYVWNMRAFAIMGALFSPILTWSSMRRVPLWRTILEPAIGGLVGAVLGFFLGSEGLFLLLSAGGVGLAAWRLNRSYRDPVPALHPAGADQSALDAGRAQAVGDHN
ncbi:MAG: hypothetical protein ABI542_10000 [Gemmatimonadota bacterium]